MQLLIFSLPFLKCSLFVLRFFNISSTFIRFLMIFYICSICYRDFWLFFKMSFFTLCFISIIFKTFQFPFGVSGRSCGLVPPGGREIVCSFSFFFLHLRPGFFSLNWNEYRQSMRFASHKLGIYRASGFALRKSSIRSLSFWPPQTANHIEMRWRIPPRPAEPHIRVRDLVFLIGHTQHTPGDTPNSSRNVRFHICTF